MRRSLKSFLRTWRHHATMQSATLSVLVGTLAITALFVCTKINLTELLTHWGQTVQMTVYLKSDDEAHVQTIEKRLHTMEEIESVTFIDKAEAARRFRSQMGSYSAGFMSDPDFGNPLPASFEIKLKEAFNATNLVSHISALVQHLTQLDGVDEVSYGQDWVGNYHLFLRTFDKASFGIIVVLLLGTIFLIAHSIRNSIYQRREEIEILELVGATTRFIRAPFLFEGAALGFIASILALALCYGFLAWQLQLFRETLQLWGLVSVFRFLRPMEIVGFTCLGTSLGLFAASLSLKSLVTGWTAAERSEL